MSSYIGEQLFSLLIFFGVNIGAVDGIDSIHMMA